jgi:hypothetical protein
MDRAPRPGGQSRPAAGFKTDYALWALCSVPLLVGAGFVPYLPIKAGFWQELVWSAQGRPGADVWRAAIVGSVAGTVSLVLGWVAQGILIEGFGARISRRPEQADDYDDKPTAP